MFEGSTPRWITLVLLLSLLLSATSCTLLKPVACGVLVPAATVADRLDQPDDDEDHNQLPAPVLLSVAAILIPFNYAYWTAHSVIAGAASGMVSDVLLVFGAANLDSTFESFLRPMKTNALKPADD